MDRNLWLAFVLSTIIIVGYYLIFPPPPPQYDDAVDSQALRQKTQKEKIIRATF